MEGLIQVIVVLIVLGVIWYFVETVAPIAEPFKTLIRLVIVLAVIFWLLRVSGIANIPMWPR